MAFGSEKDALRIQIFRQLHGAVLAAGLQRAALQQVDLGRLAVGEVDGEFDVHRVAVGVLQAFQHALHQFGEAGLGEEFLEGQQPGFLAFSLRSSSRRSEVVVADRIASRSRSPQWPVKFSSGMVFRAFWLTSSRSTSRWEKRRRSSEP
jgi:hypothetical protein